MVDANIGFLFAVTGVQINGGSTHWQTDWRKQRVQNIQRLRHKNRERDTVSVGVNLRKDFPEKQNEKSNHAHFDNKAHVNAIKIGLDFREKRIAHGVEK